MEQRREEEEDGEGDFIIDLFIFLQEFFCQEVIDLQIDLQRQVEFIVEDLFEIRLSVVEGSVVDLEVIDYNLDFQIDSDCLSVRGENEVN